MFIHLQILPHIREILKAYFLTYLISRKKKDSFLVSEA